MGAFGWDLSQSESIWAKFSWDKKKHAHFLLFFQEDSYVWSCICSREWLIVCSIGKSTVCFYGLGRRAKTAIEIPVFFSQRFGSKSFPPPKNTWYKVQGGPLRSLKMGCSLTSISREVITPVKPSDFKAIYRDYICNSIHDDRGINLVKP